ncbi:uncharacterized protein LOC111702184 [Eurytemora carolleeae]|uniref:uncharacterized protein LOC111702184 n=1 Tax=Eurytemora carolleeae TaxID=1294199 RepID=UPI000C775B57|nr:uncharacterized protein LOC111702184 [Eurytemora carolleeae]|eukprot:XP_023329565.1 uncharacterized protein LOC111702184 [Eurytemora affinis]
METSSDLRYFSKSGAEVQNSILENMMDEDENHEQDSSERPTLNRTLSQEQADFVIRLINCPNIYFDKLPQKQINEKRRRSSVSDIIKKKFSPQTPTEFNIQQIQAMQAIAEGGEDVMNMRQDRRRRSEISGEAPRHIPDEILRNLREAGVTNYGRLYGGRRSAVVFS